MRRQEVFNVKTIDAMTAIETELSADRLHASQTAKLHGADRRPHLPAFLLLAQPATRSRWNQLFGLVFKHQGSSRTRGRTKRSPDASEKAAWWRTRFHHRSRERNNESHCGPGG